MNHFVVSGTDTGVGKTWVTSLLVRQAMSDDAAVGVYKPVCSGAEIGADGLPRWEDVEQLHAAARQRFPRDLICPQRFLAPLAPPLAARQESRVVDADLLRSGAGRFIELCSSLLIEGAGGLMCPLSDDTTVLDLAVELRADVVVVAANRLGVLNHTLLTVAAARAAGLQVSAVILNETQLPAAGDDISRDSNAALLKTWLPETTLLHCQHGGERLTVVADHGLCELLQPAVR